MRSIRTTIFITFIIAQGCGTAEVMSQFATDGSSAAPSLEDYMQPATSRTFHLTGECEGGTCTPSAANESKKSKPEEKSQTASSKKDTDVEKWYTGNRKQYLTRTGNKGVWEYHNATDGSLIPGSYFVETEGTNRRQGRLIKNGRLDGGEVKYTSKSTIWDLKREYNGSGPTKKSYWEGAGKVLRDDGQLVDNGVRYYSGNFNGKSGGTKGYGIRYRIADEEAYKTIYPNSGFKNGGSELRSIKNFWFQKPPQTWNEGDSQPIVANTAGTGNFANVIASLLQLDSVK